MPVKNTIIASILMIAGMLFLNFINHSENILPRKPFSTFPKQIGPWSGKESRFDQKIYDILGVDDSILCHYTTPDKRRAELYVGYYQSQRKGDLIHSPKNCMPGAGWEIVKTSLIKIKTSENTKSDIIKLILQNGTHKQLMLYWFQSRGRIISSEYMQKIYLVIDSITRSRTDGSFVRLLTPIKDNNEEKALEILTDFAEDIMPVLTQYIPS